MERTIQRISNNFKLVREVTKSSQRGFFQNISCTIQSCTIECTKVYFKKVKVILDKHTMRNYGILRVLNKSTELLVHGLLDNESIKRIFNGFKSARNYQLTKADVCTSSGLVQ